MSFEDHATFGPVSVIGLKDKVYIGHSWPKDFSSWTEEKQKEFFPKYMHCLGLNKEEALELMGALAAWIETV